VSYTILSPEEVITFPLLNTGIKHEPISIVIAFSEAEDIEWLDDDLVDQRFF